MTTQLIEHERITTTLHKAKALRQYAEKVITIGKQDPTHQNIGRAQSIITTSFASKKLFLELAPRFKDRKSNFTRIVPMGNRKGDNAKMAYIEYLDNEIEKYEKTIERQNKENGLVPDVEKFERKVFTQERDFFKEKLNEIEEEQIKLNSIIDAQAAEGKGDAADLQKQKRNLEVSKKFFEKKLQQVEHDLFIVNKNKYDLIKYSTYS